MTSDLPATICRHDPAGEKAPVDAPEIASNQPRGPDRRVLFEKGKANDGAWIDAKASAFEEPKA